jgi:hypothetical protein
MMELDWIIHVRDAIKDVGFPIVVSGALAWASYKAGVFVAHDLVIPLKDALVAFLHSLRDNVGSINNNLDAQTKSLEGINAKQERIEVTLKAIADRGCGNQCKMGAMHDG